MSDATAILLLPAGMRLFAIDFTVPNPPPRVIDCTADGYGLFRRVAVHHPGAIDGVTRALYVQGGRYVPVGFTAEPRLDPSEAYDL